MSKLSIHVPLKMSSALPIDKDCFAYHRITSIQWASAAKQDQPLGDFSAENNIPSKTKSKGIGWVS